MINTRRAPFLSTATMSAPRGAEHVQCVTQIGPAGVPEAYQAECHGVRVDFDIRERILTRLGPCLLDVRWRAASPSSSVTERKRPRSVRRAQRQQVLPVELNLCGCCSLGRPELWRRPALRRALRVILERKQACCFSHQCTLDHLPPRDDPARIERSRRPFRRIP